MIFLIDCVLYKEGYLVILKGNFVEDGVVVKIIGLKNLVIMGLVCVFDDE